MAHYLSRILLSLIFLIVISLSVQAEDTVYLVRLTANANIRAQPTTQSAVVGQAIAGESLRFIREVPDGESISGNALWYEVEVNQQAGFVWSGVTELIEQLPLESPIDAMPGRYYHSAAWDASRERMLVFGGEDVRTHSDLFAYISADDTWIQINAPNAPSLGGHQAVWDSVTDSMFVFGGSSSGVGYQVSNELWRFDAELATWQRLNPSGTRPRNRTLFAMTIAPERREIILFGGQFANADDILNDIWIYHIDENRWEQRFPQGIIPDARQAHSAVWDPINERMLVFGGWDARGPMRTELWSYDPAANEWAFIISDNGVSPVGRFRHIALWDHTNNEMLIFGGCCGPTSFYHDLWSYNPQTNLWTQHNFDNQPPSRRQRLQGVWDSANEQVIVYGGLGECDLLNDTWRYSPANREWQQVAHAQTSLIARQGHGIGWDTETRSAWMFGGCDGSQLLGDLWQYSPVNDEWQSVNTDALGGVTFPLPRSGHITVWDDAGRQMYVMGGTSGTALYGVLNDMWRFDATSATWEALSPEVNLPRRYDSAAVWDSANEQILVYGGSVSEVNDPTEMFGDDFWRFDPQANTWEQIPHRGQYPGRLAQHGAIWDSARERLLLWGGFGFLEGQFAKIYNTQLWAYRPATDSWARMAQGGVQPSALIRFGWAWDINADMLYLFGGDRAHEPRTNADPMIYDELWRYDPSIDRWTLITIEGERPSARTRHQMFFDVESDSLYIIGGYNTTGYLDEIWRYDIPANAWERIESPDVTSYIVAADETSFEFSIEDIDTSTTVSVATNVAVSGTILTLRRSPLPDVDVVLWRREDGEHVMSMCSGADGTYHFEDVPQGVYQVAVGLESGRCGDSVQDVWMSSFVTVDEVADVIEGVDVIIMNRTS